MKTQITLGLILTAVLMLIPADVAGEPIPGLIAHWKLDEESGTTAYDSAGGNDGTLFGNPVWDPNGGQVNGALVFDGVGDYIDLGSDSILNSYSNFTISAWVKVNNFNQRFVIYSEGNSNTPTPQITFQVCEESSIYTKKLQFVCRDDAANGAGRLIWDAQFQSGWHHVVAVRQDSTAKLYLDGSSQSVSGSSAETITIHGVAIGKSRVQDYHFLSNGAIDNVRFYDRALTDGEILQIYAEEGYGIVPGLVAHWKLDEESGTTAYDSASDNDGTVSGDPNWAPNGGQIDGAMEFDGDGDYVRTTYEDTPSEYTIALWYKLNEDFDTSIPPPNTKTMVSKTGDEEEDVRAWVIAFAPQGLNMLNTISHGNHNYVAYDPGIFYKEQWHYVVATGTSTEGKIYFDGELKNITYANFFNGTWDDTVPFDIARPYLGTPAERFFDGAIDDVRIYNKVLTAVEIRQLYGTELVSLEIVGPDEVLEDSQTQYQAIAYYNNNATENVTALADWSIDPNNNYHSIGAGLLTTESIDLPEDVTITAQFSESHVSESAQKQVSILAACSQGNALEFDGQNDYVDLGDEGILNGYSDFTISAWLKVNNFNHRAVVYSEGNSNTPTPQITFQVCEESSVYPRKLQFVCRDDAANSIHVLWDTPFESGWHYIVAVRQGSTGTLYIDGESKSESDDSAGAMTINGVAIGKTRVENYQFHCNGVIDDVRMYNRALSPVEIQVNMHTPLTGEEEGLVGYWDFDEGEGQIAYDSSPNGNSGVLGSTPEVDNNDPTWIESGAPVGVCATDVIVDIKPTSCPNPLNLASTGDIPVAILGTEDFDVSKVDAASIFLEGVPAIRHNYEDVATPVADANDCACTTDGPDGFTDLVLDFETQDIVDALIAKDPDLVEDQVLTLTLTGALINGSIEGTVCVVLTGIFKVYMLARRPYINDDGVVDLLDFMILVQFWLEYAN